jgi:hypothetical protein
MQAGWFHLTAHKAVLRAALAERVRLVRHQVEEPHAECWGPSGLNAWGRAGESSSIPERCYAARASLVTGCVVAANKA